MDKLLARWIEYRQQDPEENDAEVSRLRLGRIASGLRYERWIEPEDADWLSWALESILLGDDANVALLGPKKRGPHVTNALRDWHVAYEAHQHLRPNGELSEADRGILADKYKIDDTQVTKILTKYRPKLLFFFARQ